MSATILPARISDIVAPANTLMEGDTFALDTEIAFDSESFADIATFYLVVSLLVTETKVLVIGTDTETGEGKTFELDAESLVLIDQS